jgi:hypothetical protein
MNVNVMRVGIGFVWDNCNFCVFKRAIGRKETELVGLILHDGFSIFKGEWEGKE